VIEGNLHLDVDSANLATPVSQHNNKFRRKLTQFGGNGSVADGKDECIGGWRIPENRVR